ncbi:hypothetical protein [uncultured Aliiroseovarius sp.]|uniref:hypothetical protein n=1 Tax=uncultured Aliiroseovarius sp. TaxID=1658783 RepID=UPI002612ED62|nr:hypothetical protein [uncultured Aliiroseovarius sp.]
MIGYPPAFPTAAAKSLSTNPPMGASAMGQSTPTRSVNAVEKPGFDVFWYDI